MNAPDPTANVLPELLTLLNDPATTSALIALLAAAKGFSPSGNPKRMPTIREYHANVVGAATDGTLKTYFTYWNRLVETHGDARLDCVPTSKLRELVQDVGKRAVKRRNAQNGISAQENCVSALRAFFRCAVEDGLLEENPATNVKKPKRVPSARRALTESEFRDLDQCTRSGGDDPLLDTLLLRFHGETGARRAGAIALRLRDLDEIRQCVRLHEKNNKSRWQPVSRTLFVGLTEHASARGATESNEQVFRYRPVKGQTKGAPLTRRRYNTLANRWQKTLPWAAQYGVTPHWLRHTALTAAERIGGSYGIARAFAGHGVPSDATTTYIKAGEIEVARVLSAMTGEPHPLCEGRC